MVKREEKVVIDSLSIQGYKNLEHEPDGNIPPDILINNKIAVEVRRLNQKEKLGKGIEQDNYRLHSIINDVLKSESNLDHKNSVFISHRFKRPIPSKKKIISNLKSLLADYKAAGTLTSKDNLEDSISFELFESNTTLKNEFEIAIVSDSDSGGFTVPLIIENIKLAIIEKEGKISKIKDKYPEWWLALVDTVGYGIRPDELETIKQHLRVKTTFKRLLIISPMSPENFTYIDLDKDT
jgi:hypothetical protein